MALVPRKLKGGRVVYWVANKMNGAIVYERVGLDKREAERRDVAMKREIKAGTYAAAKSGDVTVGGYASRWLPKRTNRAADNERDMWRNHVVKRCAWFIRMKMRDVRPKHLLKLVKEIALPYEGARTPDGKLSPKMVTGVYGVCTVMFRDAHFEEVIDVDPCVLPSGTLSRQPRQARKPYGAQAALAMMAEPVRWDRRVWNALAFFTGMREGEICGRRWRDWDPERYPLGALTCATQYRDQPLKTEKHGGERPRIIPVHPELDRILREWWETGFELVFCRRPTMDDFIVPHETIGCHTKSSGYKAWRKSCAEAGVGNITLHSTRNTFITWTRRGGARKEVLERVTHNAKGDIVDRYTEWDWRPLCEAVSCLRYDAPQLDSRLDRMRIPLGFKAPAPGLEHRARKRTGVIPRQSARLAEHPGAAKTSKVSRSGAELDAGTTRPRMRRRLKELVAMAMSGEVDAEARVLRGMRRVARLLPPLMSAGRVLH